MAETPKISFDKLALPTRGTVVALADADLKVGPTGGPLAAAIAAAAPIAGFTGKAGTTLELFHPADGSVARLLVVGIGKATEMGEAEWTKTGGAISAKLGTEAAGPVTILAETSAGVATPEAAADIAFGLRLGAYAFDAYKTKKKDGENGKTAAKVVIATANATAARKAHQRRDAVAEGVVLARDLVNLPPNDLGPVEFAKVCEGLAEHGVEVEVLTEKEMKKLGMGALLGVGQGSVRGSRLVVMRWNGGPKSQKPLAFVGKGVVFDTGGISIKPAQGMEDMKGDMGGAAAVTGLMRALAGRKAKVNVVGMVGLVENMPDGNAQRPGDIVKSMSGQTIEIINTDAEGRLVLADALWYCQDRFEPAFMIDLATLTGAIMVALGHEHAGLFSNDDALAEKLAAAGKATGEKVWRMPLAPEYDKIIDSKFADVKNSGGRNAGAITAAHFLQRFVDDTPWAHLDIAGTAFGTNATELSKGWTQGYGVRLLDRLVADGWES